MTPSINIEKIFEPTLNIDYKICSDIASRSPSKSDLDYRSTVMMSIDEEVTEDEFNQYCKSIPPHIFAEHVKNWTPLAAAIYHENIPLMNLIVQLGGKRLLELGNQEGKTPIVTAIEKGKFNEMQELIKMGASVNTATQEYVFHQEIINPFYIPDHYKNNWLNKDFVIHYLYNPNDPCNLFYDDPLDNTVFPGEMYPKPVWEMNSRTIGRTPLHIASSIALNTICKIHDEDFNKESVKEALKYTTELLRHGAVCHPKPYGEHKTVIDTALKILRKEERGLRKKEEQARKEQEAENVRKKIAERLEEKEDPKLTEVQKFMEDLKVEIDSIEQ